MACKCSKTKDQTHKDAVSYAINNRISTSATEGFGLFLIPAPEKGTLETRTLIIEKLSYMETQKRGLYCLAYQWIPRGIKVMSEEKELTLDTVENLQTFRSGRPDCWAQFCESGGCRMGCWCWSYEEGTGASCRE